MEHQQSPKAFQKESRLNISEVNLTGLKKRRLIVASGNESSTNLSSKAKKLAPIYRRELPSLKPLGTKDQKIKVVNMKHEPTINNDLSLLEKSVKFYYM